MKKYTYGETLRELSDTYKKWKECTGSKKAAEIIVKRAAAEGMHSKKYDIDYAIKIVYNEFYKA